MNIILYLSYWHVNRDSKLRLLEEKKQMPEVARQNTISVRSRQTKCQSRLPAYLVRIMVKIIQNCHLFCLLCWLGQQLIYHGCILQWGHAFSFCSLMMFKSCLFSCLIIAISCFMAANQLTSKITLVFFCGFSAFWGTFSCSFTFFLMEQTALVLIWLHFFMSFIISYNLFTRLLRISLDGLLSLSILYLEGLSGRISSLCLPNLASRNFQIISFSIFSLDELFLGLCETVEQARRNDWTLLLDADDSLLELILSSVPASLDIFLLSESAILCLCTLTKRSSLYDWEELMLQQNRVWLNVQRNQSMYNHCCFALRVCLYALKLRLVPKMVSRNRNCEPQLPALCE